MSYFKKLPHSKSILKNFPEEYFKYEILEYAFMFSIEREELMKQERLGKISRANSMTRLGVGSIQSLNWKVDLQ